MISKITLEADIIEHEAEDVEATKNLEAAKIRSMVINHTIKTNKIKTTHLEPSLLNSTIIIITIITTNRQIEDGEAKPESITSPTEMETKSPRFQSQTKKSTQLAR